MYETSSGVLASGRAERSVSERLRGAFYVVHSKAGVIEEVYYPADESQDALAVKKGTSLF